ncbi:MAG: hypothetical protein Q9162_002240 [Coniocarpon cinnabarinum]
MADDEALQTFMSVTNATEHKARQYLQVTDTTDQALALWFENDGKDLGSAEALSHDDPISDRSSASAAPAAGQMEDDEAMARRLQNELGPADVNRPGSRLRPQDEVDPETGVRAPLARTAERMADPVGSTAGYVPGRGLDSTEILENIRRRQRGQAPRARGIFEQHVEPSTVSTWDQSDESAEDRILDESTGGASTRSDKYRTLAAMFRPPFELISPARTWDGVRAQGKELEKWLLVNVQHAGIFDCQKLNRDIWSDTQVRATIKENFIFKQWTKVDQSCEEYIRFYFHDHENDDAYPHIAILDPRTGEQLKLWSGSPGPTKQDFLMQVHEFLDRYSMKADARNPVAMRKSERKKEKDLDKLTEEEQLQLAMQNSMGTREEGPVPKDQDPDDLTRPAAPPKGNDIQGYATYQTMSRFDRISSFNPHTEPEERAPNQTRIQFRHSGGRVIHRFDIAEPVERIYEWLKADPIPETAGKEFQLTFLGTDLIDAVKDGKTIASAGLRNGSVMIEFGD